jgi:hypothetical protein
MGRCYDWSVHRNGLPVVWTSFVVDGETYYWTAYASARQVGNGPWAPVENLDVSRRPDTAGIGRTLPAGTLVTEQHAVDLVRLGKAHGKVFP